MKNNGFQLAGAMRFFTMHLQVKNHRKNNPLQVSGDAESQVHRIIYTLHLQVGHLGQRSLMYFFHTSRLDILNQMDLCKSAALRTRRGLCKSAAPRTRRGLCNCKSVALPLKFFSCKVRILSRGTLTKLHSLRARRSSVLQCSCSLVGSQPGMKRKQVGSTISHMD